MTLLKLLNETIMYDSIVFQFTFFEFENQNLKTIFIV